MDRLTTTTFDVLIIGGGIVGAGIARDAAMRGLEVALIEQNDFASGTSSRSTRLLHGGIRYLAQGRVGLVREANKEKVVIDRIAPHLSEPLAFIFPTRSHVGMPRWKLSIGVKLYDLLCGRRNLGRSRTLSTAETLRAIPGYDSYNLTGAVRYFDALTNDARLVIDTLQSASANGAEIHNYVKFDDVEYEDGIWVSVLTDQRSGERMTVRSRCIVNAAGPWSDRIPGSQTSLRVTKGVHLVVDRTRLPVDDAIVTVEDERILFVIPWGERIFLGTTDTDYDGPLDEPPCDAVDVRYILTAVNKDFPQAKLAPDDVISTWSGLRPLVADRRGNPSDISRRHNISMSRAGWWDVTGGKLTTYRLMGEEAVDSILRYLQLPFLPSSTAETPLLTDGQPTRGSSILPPKVGQEIVEDCCRREWARRLVDVMIRRTSWRHYHVDHLKIAEKVAGWMKAELNWSDEEMKAELQHYRDLTQAAGG